MAFFLFLRGGRGQEEPEAERRDAGRGDSGFASHSGIRTDRDLCSPRVRTSGFGLRQTGRTQVPVCSSAVARS